MTTISGLGGVSQTWGGGQSRKAEHEARLFAKVDSDGSGSVDATELAAMLAKGPQNGQSTDSAALLKKMDSDGNGSLSQDELSQGMRDLMPPPASTLDFAQQRSAANDDDAFASLDTDGDGQISRAEFDAARLPPPDDASDSSSTTITTTTTLTTSSASATSATSSDYDPLDANKDGTVSEIERLAGELKVLAQAANSTESSKGLNPEIGQLAQKLYDQIAKNWLTASSTTSGSVSTTA
jgi:Ca2+-binding EF-hand superfamily protein